MEKTIVTGDPRVDWKIRRGVPTEYVRKVPDTVMVGETTAQGLIPSGYFLDLRASTPTATTRTITADWAVLHDSSDPWNTIRVAGISVTNDLTVAGPTPNGRDRATEFGEGWVYFFLIYNPSTNIVASLSSNYSYVTPLALPEGYLYYLYVGSCYVGASGMSPDYQLNDKIYRRSTPLLNTGPAVAGTFESLDLSSYVPPTAKAIWGQFGLSADPGGVGSRGMAISCSSLGTGDYFIANSFANLPPVAGYAPYGGSYFYLPLKTAQALWWTASSTAAAYEIIILGWEEDL